MRLVNIYSNRPDIFPAIEFQAGLNIVVAEIRLPENRGLDTHNLGKSTLARVIDFSLLKQKDSSFFLFAHPELFSSLTFFIQLQLDDGDFLTVARSVDNASKASFVRTASQLSPSDADSIKWDVQGAAFGKSKILLDGYLNIGAVRPWGFRKIVGYLLRSQKDYANVFQLDKFSGKHSDWKPFVARLLGLEGDAARELYRVKDELAENQAKLDLIKSEWPEQAADVSVIEGLIASKKRDSQRLQTSLDGFDFSAQDSSVSIDVAEELDAQIAAGNDERYRLQRLQSRIAESLEGDKILFRPKDAELLFSEAGVLLGEQVRRDYEQLVRFNRAITSERREALMRQKSDISEEISALEQRLDRLAEDRSRSLAYLRESEAMEKYRQLSDDLVHLRSDLLHLEERRAAATKFGDLSRERRLLSERQGQAIDAMENEVRTASSDEKSRFALTRKYFDDILMHVVGQHAVLAVKLNDEGGLEFSADFVNPSGLATEEGRGTSYGKLLAIAFDLAVLRANMDRPFPRFVFHDGAFEGLERRKQQRLMEVLREYSELGLQLIVTALDIDLEFDAVQDYRDNVVLTLHDEGTEGRLFRCDSW